MSTAASPLASQIDEAHGQGYSDDDIIGHLSQSRPELASKIKEAQAQGHSASDITGFLRTWNQPQQDNRSTYQRVSQGIQEVNPLGMRQWPAATDKIPSIGETLQQTFWPGMGTQPNSPITNAIHAVPMVGPGIADVANRLSNPETRAEAAGNVIGAGMGGVPYGEPVAPRMVPRQPGAGPFGLSQVDPGIAMVRALRPTPSDSGFVERIPQTLANIKRVATKEIAGNEDLIPATKAAIDAHQQALEGWITNARTRGATARGDQIAASGIRALPDSMMLESPEQAQAIANSINSAYRGRQFSVDELRQLLREKNAELDSFYSKAEGKQSATVTSGAPQAVVKAQRDAIADTLYRTLDPENGGEGPRAIQRETGDMMDILDAAQRRRNAIIAEKPVSTSEKITRGLQKVNPIRVAVTGKPFGTASLPFGAEGSAEITAGTADPLIRRAFQAVQPSDAPRLPTAFWEGKAPRQLGPGLMMPPVEEPATRSGVPAYVHPPNPAKALPAAPRIFEAEPTPDSSGTTYYGPSQPPYYAPNRQLPAAAPGASPMSVQPTGPPGTALRMPPAGTEAAFGGPGRPLALPPPPLNPKNVVVRLAPGSDAPLPAENIGWTPNTEPPLARGGVIRPGRRVRNKRPFPQPQRAPAISPVSPPPVFSSGPPQLPPVQPMDQQVVPGMAKGGVVKPQAGGSVEDRVRGSANIPLSQEGTQEALTLGQNLARKGFGRRGDTITPGKLDRAQQTAQAIAQFAPHAKMMKPDPSLDTWRLGAIEGQPTDQVKSQIEDLINNPDKVPPPGSVSSEPPESWSQFKQRYLPPWKQRIQQYLAHPNNRHIYTTHGRGQRLVHGWIKAGMPDSLDVDPKFVLAENDRPADVHRIALGSGGRLQVKEIDTAKPGRLKSGILNIRHASTDWNHPNRPGKTAVAQWNKGGVSHPDIPAVQPLS